jgi:hypothetical protein
MQGYTAFSHLVCASEDNIHALGALVDQLSSRVGVVPFVGAGLSIPYGYPGWGGFLLREAEKAGARAKVARLLRAQKYEEAAECLLHARSRQPFLDSIRRTYGADMLPADHLQGAARHVPALTEGPVVTTNYDPVLETAFSQSGQPFKKTIVGARLVQGAEGLHGNLRYLLKLHGDFDDSENRILTASDYREHYGADDGIDPQRPLPRLLELIIMQRPLLFIGCSLSEDRTMKVLESVIRKQPGVIHYAILAQPARKAEFLKRQSFLGDRQIRCIWYPNPDGHHTNLGPLLAALAAEATARRAAAAAAPAPGPCVAFSDLCTPDDNSVNEVLSSGRSDMARIAWHGKVAGVMGRLSAWAANFDAHVRIFRWACDPGNPNRDDDLTELRAQIVDEYHLALEADARLQENLRALLVHTAGAAPEHRGMALLSYAGLAALKMIRRLQSFENRLWMAQARPMRGNSLLTIWYPLLEPPYLSENEILTLSGIKGIDPAYLVPTYVPGSPIARLALRHVPYVEWEQFFVCRIRDGKALARDYERIVMPKLVACYLQSWEGRQDVRARENAYYSTVLPHWLAQGLDRVPDPQTWEVWVVEDQHHVDYRCP